jgi:hypothetical protein
LEHSRPATLVPLRRIALHSRPRSLFTRSLRYRCRPSRLHIHRTTDKMQNVRELDQKVKAITKAIAKDDDHATALQLLKGLIDDSPPTEEMIRVGQAPIDPLPCRVIQFGIVCRIPVRPPEMFRLSTRARPFTSARPSDAPRRFTAISKFTEPTFDILTKKRRKLLTVCSLIGYESWCSHRSPTKPPEQRSRLPRHAARQ